MSFPPDYPKASVRASPNFGARRTGMPPDMIVLHYTGMGTGPSAEDWLCDQCSEVSSHYLIHEDGRVVQMVREADRAWHAGASIWKGRSDINSASIGIEIVNPGHPGGCPPYPHRQVQGLVKLCRDIMRRQGIAAGGVVGHSDIAPSRKSDPGEWFPWRILGEAGLAHYVAPVGVPGDPIILPEEKGRLARQAQTMLAAYGYGIEESGRLDAGTSIVLKAFQRRFRPERVDGVLDRSTFDTLRLLVDTYAIPAGVS